MTGWPGERAALDSRWRRLHPLSPVVRSGRGALAVLAVAVGSAPASPAGPGGARWTDLAVVALAAGAAMANWLVTRWKLDGTVLSIETGLVRRDCRQLPIARIQAVDVVRPFLARALGLAEVRVRLAGSGHADGRLAYLPESSATALRAALLAAHHGLDPATAEPPERVLVVVPPARLLAAAAISAAGLACAAAACGAAAAVVLNAGPVALAATAVWCLAVCLPLMWRRVSALYGFTVAASPDGIRIRRGLLGTVAETIPLARVQAVRVIEPLLWRPLGWRRLEVDVAGAPARDRAQEAARGRTALLPVGPVEEADLLLSLVAGPVMPTPRRPPRRAWWKAPLSCHFLAAGHDGAFAVAVTGRLRRTTAVVPLAKAQSIRLRQGPLQRLLGLASVHVDAAGGAARAAFLERSGDEAARLLEDLAAACRRERQRGRASALPASAQPASALPASALPASAQPASAQPGSAPPGSAPPASVASSQAARVWSRAKASHSDA